MSVFSVLLLVVLCLYALSLIGLFIWALLSSFKSPSEFRVNSFGLPQSWVWNYSIIFKMYKMPLGPDANGVPQYAGMGQQYLNTILYALGCAFVQTTTQMIVAYVCARFNFKFLKPIYTVVIIVMIIPIVGSLPSEIQMAKTFGLFDSIPGMWVMKLNFLGLYFLVFYSSLKALPQTYTEAAKIDGADNFTIMLKIIFPMVFTTYLTVLLLNFIGYWNDYQVPLVYLPHYPTISLGLFRLGTSTDNILASVPMRMTAAMLVFVPILLLYIFTNQKLLGNLTAGGIKG